MLTDTQARDRIVALAVDLYDRTNLLYRYEYKVQLGYSPKEALSYALDKTVADGRRAICYERRL